MAEKLNEQVSALMDDECAPQEIKLALRRLERDIVLQNSWERYHLVREVLKGSTPPVIEPGFADRLRTVIDAEPPLRGTTNPPAAGWRKPALGFALAASVAAVTVVVLRDAPDGNPILPAVPGLDNSTLATVPPELGPGDKLNAYLINHNSLASMSSVYGVMPYVRMASYQTGR